MDSIISLAKCILRKEANSIIACEPSINEKFVSAVELIKNCTGKILMTGVGKSGNIACKISSTFSSTGSPSIFLHPTDASHGDLGIIGQKDVIIALSNSGETTELFSIINFANRFSIKLISITSNINSTLAKSSDIAIVIPKLTEAGSLNIAPTSSTTAMLAIGDALALCVCNEKQFTLNNFKDLHPGGAIGMKLLKVSDIMKVSRDQLPFCTKDTDFREIIEIISAKGQGCIAVLDDDQSVIGVITDGDLRRSFNENIFSKKAVDIMIKDPIVISKDDLLINALKLMNTRLISNLFVINDTRKLIGILHLHDCIRPGFS